MNLFDLFRTPSARALRIRKIAETERDLLEAEASAEYWLAIAPMYRVRLMRLRAENCEEASAANDTQPAVHETTSSVGVLGLRGIR